MDYSELSKKLMRLQEEANPGMGISCVRTICFYLELGDIESARATARNEGDKISGYPQITILIHENLVDLGRYYQYAKYPLFLDRTAEPEEELEVCDMCCKSFPKKDRVTTNEGLFRFCSNECAEKDTKERNESGKYDPETDWTRQM